jgi:protein involved in polysaccharide export with SLBB domain
MPTADRTIEPNDRLIISTIPSSDPASAMVERCRVDPAGFIYPWPWGPIAVAGKLPPQVEASLSKPYTDNLIFKVEIDESGAGVTIPSAPFRVGDHLLLHLNFHGEDRFVTQLCQVDKNGNILLPLVGTVKIIGLTEQETERAVDIAFHPVVLPYVENCIIERISPMEAQHLLPILLEEENYRRDPN